MTRAGWRRDNLNVILMSEHVPLVGTRPATTTTTAQPKTKTNAVLQLCREQSAKTFDTNIMSVLDVKTQLFLDKQTNFIQDMQFD